MPENRPSGALDVPAIDMPFGDARVRGVPLVAGVYATRIDTIQGARTAPGPGKKRKVPCLMLRFVLTVTDTTCSGQPVHLFSERRILGQFVLGTDEDPRAQNPELSILREASEGGTKISFDELTELLTAAGADQGNLQQRCAAAIGKIVWTAVAVAPNTYNGVTTMRAEAKRFAAPSSGALKLGITDPEFIKTFTAKRGGTTRVPAPTAPAAVVTELCSICGSKIPSAHFIGHIWDAHPEDAAAAGFPKPEVPGEIPDKLPF